MMKKFLNKPNEIIDETMRGYAQANRKKIRLEEGTHRMLRVNPKEKGKVKLVVGNGGGHEPCLMGWIGEGMYDMVCLGDFFAAQSGPVFYEAISSIDDGSPILLTISNHAGDVMNGNIAYSMCVEDDMEVKKVLFYDDIATAPKGQEEERRGGAGMLFSIKTAGALAERGADLDEVARMWCKARDNTRTLSIALTSWTHPATGETMASTPDDLANIGAGVHGEAGPASMPFTNSYTMISKMCDMLVEDQPCESGDEIVLLINGMGATTMMEMGIVAQDVAKCLAEKGIKVYDTVAGNFVTTQEMAGLSLSFLKLDDELKELWDEPCSSPAYTNK